MNKLEQADVKAVIFDYGGVFSAGGSTMATTFEALGVSEIGTEPSLAEVFWPLFKSVHSGEKDESQMWAEFTAATGVKPVDNPDKAWYDFAKTLFVPDPEMVRLAKDLKKSGFYLGLLSNMTPIGARAIRDTFDMSMFDDLTFSCELKAGKPAATSFNEAIRLSGFEPGQCLMLDDLEKNIDAAKDLGMQVYQVIDIDQSVQDLRSNLGLAE